MQPCITASLRQRTRDRLFGTKDMRVIKWTGGFVIPPVPYIVRPETVLTHCLFLIFSSAYAIIWYNTPDTMQRITMEVTTMVMAKVWEP